MLVDMLVASNGDLDPEVLFLVDGRLWNTRNAHPARGGPD